MTDKYGNTVEVVASALIVNKKDGKILLVRSHKWGDMYLFPGGHVEHEETILEAARREGEEETGLKLKPLHCIDIGELINDPAFNRKAHLIYFHILCEAETEEVKLDYGELKDFIWIGPQEAPKLENLGVRATINNYLDDVVIPLASRVLSPAL